MAVVQFSTQPGGSINASTQLFGGRPPITVDINGGSSSLSPTHWELTLFLVATISHQTVAVADTWSDGPLGITTPTPLFDDIQIEDQATSGLTLPESTGPIEPRDASWADPTVSPLPLAPGASITHPPQRSMTLALPVTHPASPGRLIDDVDEDDRNVSSECESVIPAPPLSLLRICDGIRQIPSPSPLSQVGLSLSSALPRDFHAHRSRPLANQMECYSTLLATNTALQNSYNDLLSSHRALQFAYTSAQRAHSAILSSTSASNTSLPQFISRPSTPPPPNSPIDTPAIPQVPPDAVSPQPTQLQPMPVDTNEPSLVSHESSTQTSPLTTGVHLPLASDDSSSHASDQRTLLNDGTSEPNTHQTSSSEHSEWSDSQIVQAVDDLNGELAKLASAISDFFVSGSDAGSECSNTASLGAMSPPRLPNSKSGRETHDRLKDALGSNFYHLIFTHSDPPSDPSLVVQYAIQAWQVWCCSRILDGFCFGLPGEVDRLLTDVWESMKREGMLLFSIPASPHLGHEVLTSGLFAWDETELQPMSSRWRGLTHEYLRGVLTASPEGSTQLTPTTTPSTSALYKSESNELLSVRTLQERELFGLNIRGVLAILSGVGLEVDQTSLPPYTRDSPTPGGDLSAVVDGNVINTTKVVEEFGETLKRIQEQAIELATITREGVTSGWFEITRVSGAVTISTDTSTSPLPLSRDVEASVMRFDHRTMDNVLQGLGREDGECVVMCTIEFGVDCVRKVVSDEDAGVVPCPIEPIGPPPSRAPEEGVGEGETMERKTLVKPKVLLESVIEIMR